MAVYDDDLRLAHVIADMVDSLTASRFQAADLRVETKPDLTPVSDADRTPRNSCAPSCGGPGRGTPWSARSSGPPGTAPRQWVIDPIDGTKNFVRGVPVWATLIALLDEGDPVVGVVSAPALGRGGGRRRAPARGPAAACPRPAGCTSRRSPTSPTRRCRTPTSRGWERAGRLEAFLELQRSVWRSRAYGDFWSYMLVAEGAVDVAAEPDLQLYDMAALVPVVVEAGGRFTSLEGADALADMTGGGSAVVTNGRLHRAVLEALTSRSQSDSSFGASSRA